MFENDKENEFFTGGETLDLGSSTDDVFANFSLFDDDKPGDVLGDEALNGPSKVSDPDNSNTSESKSAEDKMEVLDNVENASQPEQSVSNKEQSKDSGKSPNIEAPNLFEEAIAKAEEKQAENTKNSLAEKLPVPSQQKWTQKSLKKRNESQYFLGLRKLAAFIPRFT